MVNYGASFGITGIVRNITLLLTGTQAQHRQHTHTQPPHINQVDTKSRCTTRHKFETSQQNPPT